MTITGTVTNRGTAPLFTVQAMTWRDPRPITSARDLADVYNRDPNAISGTRIDTEGSFETIVPEGKTFEPGATASFTVTAKLSDLGFTQQGIYLVGIHIRAATDRSSNYVTVARARTFLPVTTTATSATTLTSVVWLTSRPSYLRAGTLVDDHLADELRGRLLTLVRSAHRPGVSYAIDPALYREITTMAAGYTVVHDSTSTPGTGQQAAIDWLAEYASLRSADGFRLPYGNPDLALALASGDGAIPQRSANALGDVPQLAALPLLLKAPNGRADEAFLKYVVTMRPSYVLSELDGGRSVLQSPGGYLANLDTGAFGIGPGPDLATTLLQRVQRSQASSLLASMSGAGGVVRVVDDQESADVDDAPIAPWEQRVVLSSLVPNSSWAPSMSTGTARGPMTTALLAPLSSAAGTFSAYGDLLANPIVGTQLEARALAAVPSASWGSDDQAREYLADTVADFTAFSDGVRIRVAPRVVMTNRDTQFPLTVSNSMPNPVRVKIVFESSNPGRVSVPDSQLVTVASGDSVTVNAHPSSQVNGQVDVVAQLATTSGAPVGTPQRFVIDATEAGKVGWVIVIASGLVVVVSTVWRIRTVARSRGRGEAT